MTNRQALKNVLFKLGKYKIFWLVTLPLLALDQFTKWLVVKNIPPETYLFPGPIPVLTPYLYWVHIHNTGAAWGQFSGNNGIFLLIALAAILAMYAFRKALYLHKRSMQVIFGFIASGVVGNLLDRIIYGHVIDFIDVHLPFYRWPAFNIADSAIAVGVVMYLWIAFFSKES